MQALFIYYPKKCDDFRMVGNSRALNNVTQNADCYPLPYIIDFVGIAQGCTIVSKSNRFKKCHQITVAKRNQQKTAIITGPATPGFNSLSRAKRTVVGWH